VPGRTVSVLEHLWKRAAAPELQQASDPASIALARRLIRLEWGKDRLQMRFGRVCMVTRLIQGTFPNYRQLIPTEHTASVTVDAADMLRALRQMAGRAREGAGAVRLRWEGESIQVSTRTEDMGEVTVPLSASCTAPGKTALNITYLLGYFKAKEGTITISITGDGNAPVTFAHRGTPHMVMMPMVLKEE
jgi:DNA polymerase-3 subunit beta